MSKRSVFLLLILLVWFLVGKFELRNQLLSYAMQIADHPAEPSFQPIIERWVSVFLWGGVVCFLTLIGSVVLDLKARYKNN